MRKNLAVFNSDKVNKYRMVFPIEALISGLEQSWEIGKPSFISHDCHRPIAWSKGLSLYFEPGMVRLAGIVFLPESQEDSDEILHATKYALSSSVLKYFTKYGEELKRKIPEDLLATAQPHAIGCAAFIGENLAEKLFPDIFSKGDRDGLIPLSELKPIGPGVFEHDGLLIFAHQFFRRSLSRLNSLNESFLGIIQEFRTNPKISAKILLDRDMVGLTQSYLSTIELEYWWGPKFDQDLSKIPIGVTTHKASEITRQFHGISRTEFWWHLQNKTRTLECEELRDIPSFGLGNDKFGCRYIHSIIDLSNSEPFHLDGAIRLYNEESMIERIDKCISKSGRHTDYIKLWRLDGNLDIEIWKKAITHYYRDNPLIGEYLGGRDDAEPLLQITKNHSESRYSNKFISCEISKGSGIRVSVSYSPIVKASEQSCYALSLDSLLLKNTTQIQYIESDTIELRKLLEKRHSIIAIPHGIALVEFEDMLTNFPLIQHTGPSARSLAQLTHDAIKQLCSIWMTQGHDRIVTYNMCVQYENKNICFSIAGHVDDLYKWHLSETCNLPTSEEDLGDWCNGVAEFISSNGLEVYDNPPIENLLNLSGLLVVKRIFIHPSLYKLKYNDEQHLISFEVLIDESNIELINSIKEDNLKLASAWLVNESLCSKCNSLYTSCGCSKYFKDDVCEIMHNVELLGAFWTRSKA